MLDWLASQPTAIIAPVVFSLCYLTAAAVFAAVAVAAGRRGPGDFKAVSPVTLTPLAVIVGLLTGFLAAHVWTNVERADAHIGHEAGALREALLLAESLPPETATRVRAAIGDHLHAVVEEEWPAMARGEETLRHLPVALTEAMVTLLSFSPAHPGQQLAQQRALVAIEEALDARRNRILLSEASLGAAQWLVIFVLCVLILATIAMVHVEHRRTQAITLFIFATAMASCFVLLLLYDRPFGGGISVGPEALRQVMPD